jgi:xanthine dehydrogenase accessory factor
VTNEPDIGTAPDKATFYEQVVALEREASAFVLVVLVETAGSAPQDAGAKMLVTPAGLHAGTVGGGRLEAAAVTLAQKMLADGATAPRSVHWRLGRNLAVTCGGAVQLYFEPHPANGPWTIAVFGAGHVAQALLPVLLPLPCSITCCDPRAELLEKLPRARNLRAVQRENPADLVPALPDGAFVVCLTQSHETDRLILQRTLAERDFPFVGVIGSAAKAAALRRALIGDGLKPARAAKFHCTIGLDFGTNHPHEIALSIAAQLLSERDRLREEKPKVPSSKSQIPRSTIR